jgi:IclR family transcriptional regulator, KDG regulon repressor
VSGARSGTSHDTVPRDEVRAVSLTIDILEALRASETPLGVSELALSLGVGKATIFRHLQTLVSRGYAVQGTDNPRYALGPAVHALVRPSASPLRLLSAAGDIIRALLAEVDQTVVLSQISESSVTVLQTAISSAPLEIGVRVGVTLPLHASAQGKVALAYNEPLRRRILATALPSFTAHTVTEPKRLDQELRAIAERGWAVSSEQMTLGISALAVPILGAGKICVGSLAIVGSVQFVRSAPDPAQLAALIAAGRALSHELE